MRPDRPDRAGRAAPLAAWATAWLAGSVPADDALATVTGGDAPHRVLGLDGPDSVEPLSELLIRWRRAGGPVRLVLPVPGDVRGVPGPADFRAAALEQGEAAVGAHLAVVPEYLDPRPSSAPPSVLWHAHAVDPAPPDPLAVSEAAADLRDAIRECTSALLTAEVGGARPDLVADLGPARRAGERLDLPPGHPPAAVLLLAQAERLAALLELAARDPVGGAIERTGIQARLDALRPLQAAVRRGRLAGWNAGADGAC